MIGNIYGADIPLVPPGIQYGIEPENGWWWDPNRSGQGMSIENQNGVLFFAIYTYDQSGNPIWYSASGQLIKNTVRINLSSYSGGACPDCPYHPPEFNPAALGSIEITFTSPEKAEITWADGSTTTIVRYQYNLGFGLDPLVGEWALISKQPINNNYQSTRISLNKYQCTSVLANDPPNNTVVLGGTVTAMPADAVKVKQLKPNNDFMFLMKVSTPEGPDTFYAFNMKGVNKIAGLALVTSEENFSLENLSTEGNQFQGYRAKYYNFSPFAPGPGRPICP
ncbi:hypothetical protein TAO_0764 [Candidatus Nitrosoglobus terrae]|uniref:Uncharacterized protein n=1 Tax=Candidatus Nitrosoglobus terrae TaxID=1630141 RepID=A0A1Q2SLX4_9GAMM|nr:hypothetical protein [Candidatus Nitrosoglobus terrae]BAW80134.1 hypothetical protein TAO_0764 [Candidatus Nitrosoglobus terrae]